MTRRVTPIAILAALTLASAHALAQAPAAPAAPADPTAETLLDNHVKAVGGKEAFAKLNTRAIKARLEVPAAGVSMAISIWAARPNKTRTLVESDIAGRIERGFDGTTGWEVSTTGGPRLLAGAQLDDMARDATFEGLAVWRDWVDKTETQGAGDVDGKPAWKVLITPKRGSAQTYFFDQATSLVVKMTMTVRSAMGDVPAESYFSDYRDAGGIRIAHRVRQVAAGQELVTTIDSITHNVELPAGRFDPPVEIQALLTKK